jgi:hypothetical protein
MMKYSFAEIFGAVEWLEWLDWWTVWAGIAFNAID